MKNYYKQLIEKNYIGAVYRKKMLFVEKREVGKSVKPIVRFFMVSASVCFRKEHKEHEVLHKVSEEKHITFIIKM